MRIFGSKEKASDSSILARAFVRSLYLFVPLMSLLALGRFELIAKEVYDSGVLLAASLLFILGIPLSLFLGVDKMQHNLGIESNELCLLIAAFVMFLNFVGLIIFFSFFKTKKKKKKRND